MQELTLLQPDDWHVHLRDEDALAMTVPAAAHSFGRSIVMPNLVPPITKLDQARSYYERIMEHRPAGSDWQPLMVLYLTDMTTPEDIREAKDSGLIFGCKYYPAGATTNSDSGVTNLHGLGDVFAAMQEVGLVLQLHGEVTDSAVDIFDREAVFIERVLAPLREKLPELRIVFEHITTAQAADFVLSGDENLAATITPHHLIINRNAILAGGIKPHYYCLPVAKRESHRQALLAAVLADTGKVFLGTDSAPHIDAAKLQPCGCAGIFNAPNTLACLAQLFENHQALDKLENFTSIYGPEFYRLPVNEAAITLQRHETAQPVLAPVETAEGPVTVFDPQMEIFWSVAEKR